MKKLLTIAVLMVVLVGCRQNNSSTLPDDKEAKAMLQGVWVDEESGDVSFRVKGDTIYFSDATSMPTYFRIYEDSLYLASGTAYGIVKQTEHLFWFKNQNSDLLKLQKGDDNDVELEHGSPSVLTYTHQVKVDSVVTYNNTRYHWYIAINPTKYKVTKRTFNDDGLEVENVYYDNIMNVSVFQGAHKIYSSDFRKQQYSDFVPASFLDEAIFANMTFSHIDAAGLHFNATLCIPDGATCYMVESTISYTGAMSMKLVEY
jgi:hypothetical protein